MINAVIVAGGSGLRMGASVKKQYVCLDGTPILVHTLKAFDPFHVLDRIVLVVPEDDLNWCKRQILDIFSFDHPIHVTAGGRRRQDSVIKGLDALEGDDSDIVMIHDGVRPFVRTSLLDALVAHVSLTGACIPAVPVTDTLKQGDGTGGIVGTLDRQTIHLAQTPQVFFLGMIRKAHQAARKAGFKVTDDASVVEFTGQSVKMIPGDPLNIKITTPSDLILAKAILAEWKMLDARGSGIR